MDFGVDTIKDVMSKEYDNYHSMFLRFFDDNNGEKSPKITHIYVLVYFGENDNWDDEEYDFSKLSQDAQKSIYNYFTKTYC